VYPPRGRGISSKMGYLHEGDQVSPTRARDKCDPINAHFPNKNHPHAGAALRTENRSVMLRYEHPPRERGAPGTKKGAKGQRMRIPHAGAGQWVGYCSLEQHLQVWLHCEKRRAFWEKACYNGVRSCSGGARTPRSAAQVRYHPGKGSITQPALGDNHRGAGFLLPGAGIANVTMGRNKHDTNGG
jgi:hypothetical protein